MSTTTIYVSIAETENVLSQSDWARFVNAVQAQIDEGAVEVLGPWFTAPASAFRSACWNFTVEEVDIDAMKGELGLVCAEYPRTSLAWVPMDIAAMDFIGYRSAR